MIASETGANGHVCLEPAGFCVDKEFGSSKGVIFVKLKQPIVVTTLIRLIESIDTKVEIEEALSFDEDARDRFLFKANLLFLESFDCYLLVAVHEGDINK